MKNIVPVESNLIKKEVYQRFDDAIPVLIELLKIPSQSRNFDQDYLTNGLLSKTAKMFADYIKSLNIKGCEIQLLEDEGYSPFLFVEVEGSKINSGTILFYGHMDKQPPFTGWREGLSAYDPKIIDEKLYGRGGADDQYAMIAATIAIKTCQSLGLDHPKIVMTFEADEESGSGHIQHYLDKLNDKIGQVDLVICLDSDCITYDQLWITSTLRGCVSTHVTVTVLNEGVHSGDASGIVPSSFRIMRELLDRIEDSSTGKVCDAFQVNIPGDKYLQASNSANFIGTSLKTKFSFFDQTQPTEQDPLLLYLNRIWRAQLSILGGDGLPPVQIAGNVLHPSTTLTLSIRLPPTKDVNEAISALEQILTTDVPYQAKVEYTPINGRQGFSSPPNQPYLDEIINQSSLNYFQKNALYAGDGGSIPLMSKLQNKYPDAQFIVTGVVGPSTNAHGPNEFLHLPCTKNLICCITQICFQVEPFLQKER